MIRLIVTLFLLWAPGLAFGQKSIDALTEKHNTNKTYPHGRNHLSLFIGNTDIEREEQGFTVGLDYEYRVNELLGLGTVVEYAAGGIDAWSLLTVADVHIYQGLVLQVGPGVEKSSEETVFIARVGVLYEFERRGLTISPQIHYDLHAGAGNGWVLGLAFGKSF